VREAAIGEAVNELKGRVSVGGEEHGSDWRDMAERIEVLEGLVKGKEGITNASGGQISERMRRLEEREKKGEVERIEMERLVAEKLRSLEEGLEKEKKDREKKESERMEEEQQKKVRDSGKEMERKVFEAMGQLKILNLKFRKESEEKGELLKEAEAIIRGKVKEQDNKECEWILRRSKVYILGKGTEEKIVKGERICTVPVLVRCGSLIEKERFEIILRSSGVRPSFHWPKEMVEFVSEIRGVVEQMGYRKEKFYVKVRPTIMQGVPQLRAEVRGMERRGERFERVACWSCPPAERRLWGNKENRLRPVWITECKR
jgi:hypothetical protein